MSFLENLFRVEVQASDVTFSGVMGSMAAALFMGILIALGYIVITGKSERSINFLISIIILPAIVAVIIMLVGSNIAGAFSIAGVFTLIKFRSAPGDGKDITLIFLAMAAGLSCAFGYVTLAFTMVLILLAVLTVVYLIGRKFFTVTGRTLKVTIPEDLNYVGVFDDIFAKFLSKYEIVKVRTTNMGTLFELTYRIVEKKGIDEKEFIDEIRTKNGNLQVAINYVEKNELQL
ncbi:MAG: DUF4956 domain-containing protein [Lachnospiraceae bacterium]|nr:DUF4956 domain-containing protein [Lachnospiraceae bacterium]